jgi:hypothetical protein
VDDDDIVFSRKDHCYNVAAVWCRPHRRHNLILSCLVVHSVNVYKLESQEMYGPPRLHEDSQEDQDWLDYFGSCRADYVQMLVLNGCSSVQSNC